jgi:hypothetical protein
MKRFVILWLSLLVCGATITAQTRNTGIVRGKIMDSLSSQPLKDATVSILDKSDSTLLVFGVSKVDGNFVVENIPFGTYILQVSFQGYSVIEKNFSISKAQPDFNAGTYHLSARSKDFGNVTVKTSPININGDTTEYNASHFKTKPNATAEDLLKKLPGVEVDKDGAVKAHGEDVKRVLVDGKRFFGDDPKTATRNLPTDIIDKVQVYDAQSDQSSFSGFDDGNREKTINIVTKKDRRKGIFGKASAGVGDNSRYMSSLSFNRFNGNQQISFIGQGNNINSQNFSIQDILGTMSSGNRGGGGMMGGGGGGGMFGAGAVMRGGMGSISNFLSGSSAGIATTWAGGLNYNDVWSKKTSVSGSYFYNNMRIDNNQDRFRETFSTNDSSLFNTNKYGSNNKNQNHRFNFEIDQKIDSFNSIIVRPTFSSQQSNNYSETNTFTNKALSKAPGNGSSLNDSKAINSSDNDGYNFNNNILYRLRFKKRGRSLSLNFSQGLSNSSSVSNNLSFTRYYFNGNALSDTLNQVSHTDRDSKNLGGNVSYTEPMGTKGQLEVSYNYNYTINTSDQQTMRFNKTTNLYDIAEPALTNAFENTNYSHRGGLNYRRQVNKELNYTLGLAVQNATLNSFNKTTNYTISQTFNNFFPTLSVQYSKNRTKNLRFNYRGSTRQPSVTQLQPVIDISNPLNIRSGNPDLKQEFSHNFGFFYTNFDIFTFKNFIVNLNGSLTSNKICNSYFINTGRAPVVVDGILLGTGAQYVKPVNLNGGYNLSAFVNYGFPIRKPKSNINLMTSLSHSRDVNLVNNEKSYTRNYVVSERIRYTLNYKEKLDLNFSSSRTYTMARYSQQSTGKNHAPNTDYFTQVFSIEPTYSPKSGWIFGSDFDYTINSGNSAGYNLSFPLWNASISKLVLKKKQAEIKLSVFDLLNQNKSITRTVEQNYIEDVRTTVLQRYFMISFIYNLRSFKGQQQQMPFPMNMIPRGADRQIRMLPPQ